MGELDRLRDSVVVAAKMVIRTKKVVEELRIADPTAEGWSEQLKLAEKTHDVTLVTLREFVERLEAIESRVVEKRMKLPVDRPRRSGHYKEKTGNLAGELK
jgi:hypothetical protein